MKNYYLKKYKWNKDQRRKSKLQEASLTLEASLVIPLFLFFMLAFLYFLQIFMVQEQIQSAITRMGLDLAKLSYIYQDFTSEEDANNFDHTIFPIGSEMGLLEFIILPYMVPYLKCMQKTIWIRMG